MIEKKVVIFLKSRQFYADSAPDSTEIISEGTLTLAGNGEVALAYPETALTGMEGTTTCFRVRGNTAYLERSGAVSSTLIFREGQHCGSIYETPWGAVTIDVLTTRLAHRLTERGGVLELRYRLTLDGQPMGDNHIKIRVRETARERT